MARLTGPLSVLLLPALLLLLGSTGDPSPHACPHACPHPCPHSCPHAFSDATRHFARIADNTCDPNTWITDVNDVTTAYTVGDPQENFNAMYYRLGNTTLAQCCEYCRTNTDCQLWVHNQVNSTNSYCGLIWPVSGATVTSQCPAGQVEVVGIYGNGTTPFSIGFSSPCAINSMTPTVV